MKGLADATQDGDDIRAVIRGTGANSDGFTQGGKYVLVSYELGAANALVCSGNDIF